MGRTCGAASRWTAIVGAFLLTMTACSGSPDGAPEKDAPAAPNADTATTTPDALLSPGDQPTFTRLDDVAFSVVAGVSPEGCVTVTLEDGREMLLYAPYGSRVSATSPRIRLTGGYAGFDAGDTVEVSGWVSEVWKAAGPSAPADWRRCVGGRREHKPMLVVAALDG